MAPVLWDPNQYFYGFFLLQMSVCVLLFLFDEIMCYSKRQRQRNDWFWIYIEFKIKRVCIEWVFQYESFSITLGIIYVFPNKKNFRWRANALLFLFIGLSWQENSVLLLSLLESLVFKHAPLCVANTAKVALKMYIPLIRVTFYKSFLAIRADNCSWTDSNGIDNIGPDITAARM